MSSSALKRAIVGCTAVAVATAALIVGADAASAATPPYEPDANAVGTITFYDANGNVVTSGSTSSAPFAAYAVGSNLPRSGDAQANLLFANPDPGSTPPNWYREQVGLYNKFPLTSGPSAVTSMDSSHPVVIGASGDQTLDGFESDSVRYTGSGYTNMVQVRLRTANSANQPTSTYDDADLLIDPSTHTWTQVYPTPAAATAPAAPTNVTATAGVQSATVNWTAPTDNGGAAITGYELQQSSDGGATFTDVSPAHSGTSTSQTVTGLTAGTAYVFRVAAINSAGNGPFSASSNSVTPTANTVPGAPTQVTASGGDTNAVVSWQSPSDNGGSSVTGYNVQYASNADNYATFTDASSTFNTSTLTTHTVGGLMNGTTYRFRVAAINAQGTGAYSALSSGVTPTADQSSLSIAAPGGVSYNTGAHVTGTLRDSTSNVALGAQTVYLYSRPNSNTGFTQIRKVTSSSTGAVSATVTQTASEQYQWRYTGSATHKSITSATVTVGVNTSVSISNGSTIQHGQSLKVYGSTTPATTNITVYLQQLIGGVWKNVGQAVQHNQKLPNGRTMVAYLITHQFNGKGTFKLRVSKPATATLRSSVSRTITEIVK